VTVGGRGDEGQRAGPPDGGPEREAARTLTGYLALIAAIVLHVMVGALLPLTPALGPGWMLPVSIVAWVAAVFVIWRWHRIRPIATLFVPFAMLGAWYLVLWLGSELLGWG
jgi:hypothetical protein